MCFSANACSPVHFEMKKCLISHIAHAVSQLLDKQYSSVSVDGVGSNLIAVKYYNFTIYLLSLVKYKLII